MIKYKTVTREAEIIDDILCNKCGESLKELETGDYYGASEIYCSGGYCSPVFADMSEYSFAMCEKCLDELFKTFKIDPYVGNPLD